MIIALGSPDAIEASELHALCFPDPWSAASFREAFTDPARLSAGLCEEGRLAAFAIVQLVDTEADLLTIATDPRLQRRGLARRLLDFMIRECRERGALRMTLDVAADNHPALSLYRASGFSEDGRRRGYYVCGRVRPVDAVLMSRLLGR